MSLLMGAFAALAWGIHDLVVRLVSPRGAASPLLLTALAAGTLLLAPVAILVERGGGLGTRAISLALLSGLSFAAASLGLYRAFAIGPVRLVAPICGAYPVLSLVFAALQGRGIVIWEWLAVAAIVMGLGLAASNGEGEAQMSGSSRAAALWAILGAAGFATTFALAQTAAGHGGELTVTLLARVAAMAAVGIVTALGGASLAPARAQWRALALLGALDATAISLVVAAARFPSPEHAAVVSSVFGLVTILLAWRYLREPMRPAQWLGVLIVFAAVAVVAA